MRRAVPLLAALAAASCDAPAPPRAAGAGGIGTSGVDTEVQGLAAHANATNRGVNSFGGGAAQLQNANYRTWVVVGSEVPVGTAGNATYRALVGPLAPPPSPVTGGVTAFPQPERIDYTFTSPGAASWTIELRRRVGAACADLVARRTAGAQASVSGLWVGLSPGATYCWTATAIDYRGPRSRTGQVTLRDLPTFTAGPTAGPAPSPNALAIDVSATTSTRATGTLTYAAGDCAARQTTVIFDGSDVITIPGEVVPRAQHSIELWLKVAAPSLTRNVFTALGGSVRLSLENGALRYEIRTTAPSAGGEPVGLTNLTTASALAVDRWYHVAATYGGGSVRLYVDGVNLGQRTWGGSLVDGGLDATFGGGSSSGFIGELASAAVYDRPLTLAEASAHSSAGAAVELPAESGRYAAWWFAEAPGVQSVYDSNGTHRAGVLGVLNTSEASDPARAPALGVSVALGTNTQNHSTRLSNLTGGPTYCYRVTAVTSLGTIATNTPRTFTRLVDSTPPVVTLSQINVVDECNSSAGRALTIAPPMVTDDYDTTPAIEAHLNARTGPVITFPYTFPLGSSTLHWSGTDDVGNVGWSEPQTIRIRDTTIPAVTGGPPLVIEASSPDGTPYVPRPQSATDVCDASPMVTYSPNALFPLGDTTVTFTVTDATGNANTATRVVRVVDTTAPFFQPPLETVNVGHPGVACFPFIPPTPTAADNAYRASQLTVTGTRISGPGMPNCWNLGTHVVEWRVSDPAGNVRTGQQTFILQNNTITVTSRGLEVPGVATPVPGRYYNQPVTVVFEVSQGTAPYQVVVTPAPQSLNNAGNVYRARYENPGAYPQLLVATRDRGGMGPNVGSTYLEGFGIDTTPPVIEADLIGQAGVNINMPGTFPYLFRGESLSLERVRARDGDDDLVSLRRALRFDGGDRVTVPSSMSLNASAALTLEGWVKADAFSDAAMIAKPRADGDGTGYLLGVTAAGRALFELRIGATTLSVTGGTLRTRTWHHLAATYDGRTARLFVDGVPAGHRLATGAISLGAQPLCLGQEAFGGTTRRGLSGQLADVAIWRTALDEAALLRHYRGGVGQRVVPSAQTVALWRFEETGQVVSDTTSNANHGLLGATAVGESDDPARIDLVRMPDATSSGLVDVTVTLVDAMSGRRAIMVQTSTAPVGTPLAMGVRAIGGRRCTAPLGSVCNPGDYVLDSELIALWAGATTGSYRIEIVATDAAGNTTTSRIGFTNTDFVGAVQAARRRVDTLIMQPGSVVAQNELSDAQLHLAAAESYATMASRYMDGAYLRADNAVEAMLDAEVLGVSTAPSPEDIARALTGDVRVYVRGMSGVTDARDRVLVDTANRYLLDARFYRYEGLPGQVLALSRTGNDAVAQLYAPYQAARTQLRRAQARWQELLGFMNSQGLDVDGVRLDVARRTIVEQMITAVRDMLRDSVYPEISAVLANPYTTQPQSLRELLDVLDKASPTAPDERGDLIAITDARVNDACLDRLARLNLDDLGFTLCYVRLNDLARFLDRVSEPLVHTYRFRAGVGQALFTMLELSLYVGPQGLPWITSNVPGPMNTVLVLPDDEAAMVRGAVRLSTIDFPDMQLSRTYSRYREARARLDSGDVDGAWALFVAERCLLVTMYNRYYSTNRTIPNVADPKEAPITPADVGCTAP